MDIHHHKFILLGSYTANTLGQIRSLGEKGIRPIAVLVHKNTFRIDKSKYISEVYDVDNIEEGLDLIIRKYGNEPHRPFLYTDRDDVMGLLDSRYEELAGKFIFWNAGEQGRLGKYLNKREQLILAEKCGFRIPKSEVVKVGELPKNLSYPIFTKAVDSLNPWWKGFSFICYSEEDLKSAYAQIRDVEEILLQEYIVKKNEVPYEGISINGAQEVKMLVKSVNYRFTKDSFGIYRHLEPFNDKELEEKIKAFIREIHYEGVFEIEFIIDNNDVAYFLETNFRVTQYNYAYTKFGVNFPYLYAKSVCDGKLAVGDISYSEKRPFNVISEFEDFRISCLHGNVSLFQWIKDLTGADCYQYYEKSDKSPFFWTLFSKLREAL